MKTAGFRARSSKVSRKLDVQQMSAFRFTLAFVDAGEPLFVVADNDRSRGGGHRKAPESADAGTLTTVMLGAKCMLPP